MWDFEIIQEFAELFPLHNLIQVLVPSDTFYLS